MSAISEMFLTNCEKKFGCFVFVFDLFYVAIQIFGFTQNAHKSVSFGTYLIMRLNAVALRIPTLANLLQEDK